MTIHAMRTSVALTLMLLLAACGQPSTTPTAPATTAATTPTSTEPTAASSIPTDIPVTAGVLPPRHCCL